MQSPFEGKSFSEAKAKATLRQRLFKSKGNSFSKAWAKAFDDKGKGTFNAKDLRWQKQRQRCFEGKRS
jgi:hypothetical protein